MKNRYKVWLPVLLFCGLYSVSNGQQQYKGWYPLPPLYESIIENNAASSPLFSKRFSFPKTSLEVPEGSDFSFSSSTILYPVDSPLIYRASKLQPYPAGLAFQDRHSLQLPSIAIPVAGMGYGVIALYPGVLKDFNHDIKDGIVKNHPSFHTNIDNYLRFVPALAVVGLNAAGVPGKRRFLDELVIYGASNVLLTGVVNGTKRLAGERRPNETDYYSFPSGHTATAFAAAEWLRMEYSDYSPWIGVAGYAVATSVGVLRMYKNRHWLSDVVAGAAIGFLSTRLVYVITPWIENHILNPVLKR